MQWTFLTNHSHVLLCLLRNPSTRLRELAEQVGITERAAARIVSELRDEGFLSVEKDGRRNRYAIHGDKPLRHPLEADHTVGELLGILAQPSYGAPGRRAPSRRRGART